MPIYKRAAKEARVLSQGDTDPGIHPVSRTDRRSEVSAQTRGSGPSKGASAWGYVPGTIMTSTSAIYGLAAQPQFKLAAVTSSSAPGSRTDHGRGSSPTKLSDL